MFGRFSKKPAPPPIHFFNTASGKKERFEPLKKGVATMYSCGPTVYDHIHIGNLRAYLLPDLAKRLLQYHGYDVRHTINFTDFGHLSDDADAGEDKMMKALRREKKPITLSAMREVAETYMESFKRDNAKFRNEPPTTYAPASDYVREQIALIRTLADKGYAYETSDGVYFDVTKFPRYGVLGHIDIGKLKEGARVEINPEKRHPADFALWKKGLLGWDSVWGKGFPGWHIECTAMAFATLGKQIDIHTGGEDLMYTHHNGEIAQAESATGKRYVRYWLHNAHLSIDEKKIAKSAGNGIRLSGLEDKGYPPEAFRYLLLTAHYRTPMNFTFEALDSARAALFRLKRHFFEEYGNERGAPHAGYLQRFLEALGDDLDTPKGIAILWELIKDAAVSSGDKRATLEEFDRMLGLGLSDSKENAVRALGVISAADVPEEIRKLLEARETARRERRFDEADALRQEINLKGYTLEDTPEGPRISKG
jgi:cysteinyl-tRNA synthetase